MKKWHRFLERFWQNDNTNRGIVCGLIVTQIIAYLLHVFQMMIPTVMIDWVLDDYTIQKLLTWAAASAGIYLSVQVMDGLFGGYLYYKYEIWLTQKKQEQMLARVMEKKVYEVEKYSEGYLMNLVFQDTGNLYFYPYDTVDPVALCTVALHGTAVYHTVVYWSNIPFSETDGGGTDRTICQKRHPAQHHLKYLKS